MTIEERLYSKTKISKKFGIIRALDEEGLKLINLCKLYQNPFKAEKMAKAREETLARDQKRVEEKRKVKSIPLW